MNSRTFRRTGADFGKLSDSSRVYGSYRCYRPTDERIELLPVYRLAFPEVGKRSKSQYSMRRILFGSSWIFPKLFPESVGLYLRFLPSALMTLLNFKSSI